VHAKHRNNRLEETIKDSMTTEDDRMLYRHMLRDHGLSEEDVARIARNYDQEEEDEVDNTYVQEYKKSGDSRKLWSWIVGSTLVSSGSLGAAPNVTGCSAFDSTNTT